MVHFIPQGLVVRWCSQCPRFRDQILQVAKIIPQERVRLHHGADCGMPVPQVQDQILGVAVNIPQARLHRGADRGVPAPQIMGILEVIQLVRHRGSDRGTPVPRITEEMWR